MSNPFFTDDDGIDGHEASQMMKFYDKVRQLPRGIVYGALHKYITIADANRMIEKRGQVVRNGIGKNWWTGSSASSDTHKAILINIQPIEKPEPELTELEQANYLLGLARNVAKCWLIDEPNMILPQTFLDRTSYLEVGASLKDGAE